MLTLRQRQSFYHELGQLIRAGIPFPRAIETMSQETRGGLRRVLHGIHTAIGRGGTVGEAFRAQPDLDGMEAGIIAACDRSGRIDQGALHLEGYFGALIEARSIILKRLAYPAFLLHFAVFIGALPALVLDRDVPAFLKSTVGLLLILWGLLAAGLLAAKILTRFAATSPGIDSLLRAIPVIGGIRRGFAMSRFCSTYEMHLDAGVNVIESLESAADASGSALANSAVQKVKPNLRAGEQVGPLLAASRAFPAKLSRAIRIAEDTGDLDKELARLADEYRAEALGKLDTFTAILTKTIYVLAMAYAGYRIVSIYSDMLGRTMKAFE